MDAEQAEQMAKTIAEMTVKIAPVIDVINAVFSVANLSLKDGQFTLAFMLAQSIAEDAIHEEVTVDEPIEAMTGLIRILTKWTNGELRKA
jgi:hypothetical protein